MIEAYEGRGEVVTEAAMEGRTKYKKQLQRNLGWRKIEAYKRERAKIEEVVTKKAATREEFVKEEKSRNERM